MVDHDPDEARKALVERQRVALREGEAIASRLIAPPKSRPATHDAINAKYERGEVRIITEQARYPLPSIPTMLSSGAYVLDPEYQRRHRWDDQQRSRLIESFIMNVPVPPLFLYEFDYGKFEVMDGLQRLTAVKDFYSDTFKLSGLEYWAELDGMRYSTLPTKIRAGIDRRYLSSMILLKETSHGDGRPELLKRFVFGRINTGGVQLSAQELRNALYDGPMNTLCKELATHPVLRRLWGIPQDAEQLVGQSGFPSEVDDVEELAVPLAWRDMTDVELVLRFFANRQRMIVYRDNIRDYLDAYLQAANGFSEPTLVALRELFLGTLDLVDQLFGELAFRRPRGKGWGNVPSKSIYDASMNVLSRLLDSREALLARGADIRGELLGFYREHASIFNLRGQTRRDLQDREILLEGFLKSFLVAS